MRKNIIYLVSILFFPVSIWAQNVPTGAAAPQLSLPAVPAAYNATVPVSYVRTWEPRKAVTDTTTASLNNNANFKTATAYVDGLGRPLQTVVKGNNYDGTKDIVSMNVYDEFGREPKQYLPYTPASGNNGKFRLNAFGEQQVYYNTNYADQTPFGKTEFEASPLNRATKTLAPGNNWAGSNRGASQALSFNTAGDDVKIATIGATAGAAPAFGNAYDAGDLAKTTATDEHGKQVIEYKDRQGQVIVKKVQLSDAPGASYTGWLCTYYVYDDLGRLRYVVQPKGIEWLIANGWNFSATGGSQVKEELCFIYEYDSNGRMVYKKVPGAAAVYMCYDKRDRLVYSQDGNMRQNNQWMVMFFDELNRPVSTALYSTTQTQSQLQSGLDALTAVNPVPSISETVLTRLIYSYYDEYIMPGAAAYNQGMVNTAQSTISAGDEQPENLARTELVRGMVTGAQTRVLGATTFLKTTTYYDTKARALQAFTTNIKGGTDAATMVYSFTGKVLSSYQQHNNPNAALPGTQTTNVYTRNVYNNDYLLKTEKKINNEPWKRIAEIQYDDMGKPKKKMMGDAASNFYVNMEYNIRGWLTGINKQAQQNLENGAIGSNTFYDAIFSEVLHYDYGYTKQNYNGNISGIKWANATDKQARSYGYAYDNANRLLQADFTQKNNTDWNNGAGIDYSLMWMRYDANGNIENLAQKALRLNTSAEIDRLKYDYLAYSNKLMRVTDSLNDAGTKLGDFKDGVNTGDDYAYDANGSMVLDNNKKIANIVYNHLNLPMTIGVTGKGLIEYVYDAGGNKLEKKVTENNHVTVTGYMSGFVYQTSYPVSQGPAIMPGDTLQFTSHEEGRIRYAKKYYFTGDSAYEWQYDYFYKDHLGNIRAVVTEQKDTMKYMATFEMPAREKENALFHKIPETAVLATGISGYPGTGEYTSKLNGADKRVGASTTLKVMAGDKVDLGVQYWYPNYSGTRGRRDLEYEDILGSLTAFLSGDASILSSGKASASELAAPGVLPAAIQDFFTTQGDEPVTAGLPNAYLNWLLLDEQFKLVPEGSGFMRVGSYSAAMQTLANSNITIPKSGYLYVYLSNQTVNANVFFDNLVVQHRTGPLSETTDYTAWGLDMKMIGSKAFGRLENKRKYNGYEENKTFDINLYESFYRSHDPQLGRFWQIDPKPTDFESLYAAMGNNPIKNIDILGDSIAPERTSAWNVYVISATKDGATFLDYLRFWDIMQISNTNTLIYHTDVLNKDIAEKVTKKLGDKGYIHTLAVDFHRSNYDELDESGKTDFYAHLNQGYTGVGTQVLLGMCWAGSRYLSENDRDNLPDLTGSVARILKDATVYGLKTQANALSFYFNDGNFGTLLPESYYGSGKNAAHDRGFENEWTISYYNSNLETLTQQNVYKNISLSLKGNIEVSAGTNTIVPRPILRWPILPTWVPNF